MRGGGREGRRGEGGGERGCLLLEIWCGGEMSGRVWEKRVGFLQDEDLIGGGGSFFPPPRNSSKHPALPPSLPNISCPFPPVPLPEDGKLQMQRQRGRPVVLILGSGWAAHSCIKVRGEEGVGGHTLGGGAAHRKGGQLRQGEGGGERGVEEEGRTAASWGPKSRISLHY